MASYLKFDGQQDKAEAPVQTGPAPTSIVLTAFVRVLEMPVRSAPILQIVKATDTTLTVIGIWLSGPGASNVYNKPFAVNFGLPSGEAWVPDVPIDASANPIRLGRIYKIQLLLTTSGPFSVAVDGVRVLTGTLATPLDDFTLFGWLACLGGEKGTLNALAPLRAMHADIIQAKIEVDRTLATSGGFPTADADSDPFTNMTLENSHGSNALWLLNDGSGTTAADSSGNSYPLTLTTPTWASAADPTVPSTGVARWDFASVEGYALRASDAPAVLALPIYGPNGPIGDDTAGELRLAPRGLRWWEDGEQNSQFPVASQLTASTDQRVSSRRSLKTDGAVAVSNTSNIPQDAGGAPNYERFWARTWFYDPGGGTAGRLQRFTFFTSANAIICSAGVFQAQSTTEYVTSVVGGGPDHAASGIARSVGWHEFAMYVDQQSVGNSTIKFYIDGQLVRTNSAVTTDIARIGFRELGASASNDHGYWDWMQVGYERDGVSNLQYSRLLEATGSVVLPIFKPTSGVNAYTGVTITEATAGTTSMTLGTTSYTFRHSTDGGATWSVAATLNAANLAALVTNPYPSGDALEITVTQTASMDDMGSPATRQIDVAYQPSWSEESPAISTWTEELLAAATWTEESPAAATWTEESPAAATWTEESPAAATWTEES